MNIIKYMNELMENSFLVAIQIETEEDDLKSHSFGFKNENIETHSNRVIVFPNEGIKNGDGFVDFVRDLQKHMPFKSISVANISKELYCDIFDLSEEDYQFFIDSCSHEMWVQEEWNWFAYYRYDPTAYYRIPKELVVGSIINRDMAFIENKNYYMNLDECERKKFIKEYKELILNEVRNDDYQEEYPYADVRKLIKK